MFSKRVMRVGRGGEDIELEVLAQNASSTISSPISPHFTFLSSSTQLSSSSILWYSSHSRIRTSNLDIVSATSIIHRTNSHNPSTFTNLPSLTAILTSLSKIPYIQHQSLIRHLRLLYNYITVCFSFFMHVFEFY